MTPAALTISERSFSFAVSLVDVSIEHLAFAGVLFRAGCICVVCLWVCVCVFTDALCRGCACACVTCAVGVRVRVCSVWQCVAVCAVCAEKSRKQKRQHEIRIRDKIYRGPERPSPPQGKRVTHVTLPKPTHPRRVTRVPLKNESCPRNLPWEVGRSERWAEPLWFQDQFCSFHLRGAFGAARTKCFMKLRSAPPAL